MLAHKVSHRIPMRMIISFCALWLVCATSIACAQSDELAKPTRNEILVSKMVAKLMQDDHLSNRALDDAISSRAFDLFIKNLDPLKAYFLRTDIEEFSKYKDQLDDQMKAGDYSAAFAVFNRFLDRVDEQHAAVEPPPGAALGGRHVPSPRVA